MLKKSPFQNVPLHSTDLYQVLVNNESSLPLTHQHCTRVSLETDCFLCITRDLQVQY